MFCGLPEQASPSQVTFPNSVSFSPYENPARHHFGFTYVDARIGRATNRVGQLPMQSPKQNVQSGPNRVLENAARHAIGAMRAGFERNFVEENLRRLS